MILVRSPLRITLGGGGTDLPSYADQFGGFCMTAAIDSYVYVSVMRPFLPGIYLKYSEQERVPRIADVQHPIMREALDVMQVDPQVEITTLADIPAGTGLGSSSTFTTALLQALQWHQRRCTLTPKTLAEMASTLEIDRLHAPIGRQDQYAAAFGGVLGLTICRDRTVHAAPLAICDDTLQQLEDSLLLFFTGYSRSANDILAIPAQPSDMHEIKALGVRSRDALLDGNLTRYGQLLDCHWQSKRGRAQVTNDAIDTWYALGKTHGAIGGKLVGAGGGGFLLFYADHPRKLREGLIGSGLQEVRFRFDYEGTKVMLA